MWEMLVEPERSIPLSALELIVHQGENLKIPFSRSDLINDINEYWSTFTKDMALRFKDRIRDALMRGDDEAYARAIQHISGISSMYRLNGASLDNTRLVLNIGVTDFKEYIGTTQRALQDPSFRTRIMNFGLEDHANPNYYFANPLSTCAVLVTADNYVPIGLRGNTVAIYPNTHHIIGGYVKINEDKSTSFCEKYIDLFANMKKELEQEIGVTSPDITSVDFLGIARNTITRGPEALYFVQLTLTRDELEQRWKNRARDKYEHRNLTFYPKAELCCFLEQQKGNIVPSGEAALTLFMQHYQ
jgi:hypothetical protein